MEEGKLEAEQSPLRHAPHTVDTVMADTWDRAYSRRQAAFPTAWQSENKFWPHVARIDNAWGDRNLICTCPPPEAFADDDAEAAE